MDANQQDLRWWKHLDSTTATVARNRFQHDLDVSAYLRLFKLVSRVFLLLFFLGLKFGDIQGELSGSTHLPIGF